MPMRIRPEWDVIVAGAGTSGAISAIAAARSGAKTLLVDQYGQVGGMASTGMAFLGVLDGEGVPALRGIGGEMLDRLQEVGGSTIPRVDSMFGSVTNVDPELLKTILVDMYHDAGGQFLMHSFVSDVLLNDNAVKGIVVENKSGREILPAKVVVDCTGDADVAAKAGAEFVKGRAEDGRMQPTTQIFRVGGVDLDGVFAYLEANPGDMKVPEGWTGEAYSAELLRKPSVTIEGWASLIRKAREAGEFTVLRDRIGIYTLPQRGEVTVNATRVHGIDGTNIDDLTRAEIETKRQVLEIFRFLRKYVPGFENCHLMSIPYQVGVRETRHVVGEYTITKEDVLTGRDFPDVVARGAYPLDIHDVGSKETVLGREVGGGGVTLWRLMRSYAIPYGAILPRRIENLLVAGRCISATHEAAGSARGMAVCMATGHGAGTAAALAAQQNLSPRQLDIERIQEVLRDQNAVLERDAYVAAAATA